MKKPIIALTPLWDKKLESSWMLTGYMDLIIKNGGVPVMLSFTDDADSVEEIAQRFDGFVLYAWKLNPDDLYCGNKH